MKPQRSDWSRKLFLCLSDKETINVWELTRRVRLWVLNDEEVARFVYTAFSALKFPVSSGKDVSLPPGRGRKSTFEIRGLSPAFREEGSPSCFSCFLRCLQLKIVIMPRGCVLGCHILTPSGASRQFATALGTGNIPRSDSSVSLQSLLVKTTWSRLPTALR